MGLLARVKNVFVPTPVNTGNEKRSFNSLSTFGAAVSVDADKALTFTAVWAAIRLLAESVSSLPITVYRIDSEGNKVVDKESPLYNLLKYQPNVYQNKITFFEYMMLCICTEGESIDYIERNGHSGAATQLIPLDKDKVKIIQKDGALYYETIYGIKDAHNILHFKTITKDGIRGMSPIEQCAKSIGWGMSVEEYGNTFFKNGAKLSGVLSTDKTLSETAYGRLKDSFNNIYSRLTSANSTAILEEGLTFKPVSIAPDQAQFLASRTFSVVEVARMFNLPPHMIGELSKSSFSNIEMQSQEFVTYTLMPYLVRIEEELNTKLVSKQDRGKVFVEFNVNGLLRGNTKDRAEYYRTMVNIGAMSLNEVRNKENYNKIVGGDKHFMQLNMTTIEKIGEEPKKDE